MNSTIYIFGGESGDSSIKHYQFPDDYTSSIFKRYIELSKDDSILAVSFDKSLAYHVYCKRVVGGYIGFGVVLNGCWIESSTRLLSVFDNAYTELVTTGKILSVNTTGMVQSTASAIMENEQETIQITDGLRNSVNNLSAYVKKIPIIDVSTNPNTLYKLPSQASDDDWSKNAGKYRHMYSLYGKSKNNLNKLLEQLQNAIHEKVLKQQECSKLKEQIEKVNKQKKQYELVIGLAVAMFVGALIFIAVISDKNTKIENQLATIQNNEETISAHENTISNQKATISEQTQSISRLNNRVSELENENESMQTKLNIVSGKFPMVVSYIEIANTYSGGDIETNYGNSIYSSSSRYLTPRINYTGLESGTIELKVKWFNPDGSLRKGTSSPSDCCFKQDVYVYKGESQTVSLKGWGNASAGHWNAGTYRLEIWYGSVCLASRSVRVY